MLRAAAGESGIRTFWLDRPAKRNALNEALLACLLREAEAIARDPSVRAVVVRATGPAFSGGADLNEWARVSAEDARRLSRLGSEAFQTLADLPVPVIGVVEGPALGGGFELALACDMRIGTPAARFAFPEPRLGNSPAWGGMPRLVQVAGLATARHLLLTGDPIDAQEALRLGILNRLCPADTLAEGLDALLRSVLACEPETLRFIKAVLGPAAQAIAVQEAAVAGFNAGSAVGRARKQAFLERAPRPRLTT